MARTKNQDQRAATVGASRLSRCHHCARLKIRRAKVQFTSAEAATHFRWLAHVPDVAEKRLLNEGHGFSRAVR